MVLQPCVGKPPTVLKSAATRRPEKGRAAEKEQKCCCRQMSIFFLSLSLPHFSISRLEAEEEEKNSHNNSALCHKCQFSRYKGINKLPKRSSQMVLSIRTLFFAIVKIFSCAKASSAKCMNQCDKRK